MREILGREPAQGMEALWLRIRPISHFCSGDATLGVVRSKMGGSFHSQGWLEGTLASSFILRFKELLPNERGW